jgi:hypothetical protein
VRRWTKKNLVTGTYDEPVQKAMHRNKASNDEELREKLCGWTEKELKGFGNGVRGSSVDRLVVLY